MNYKQREALNKLIRRVFNLNLEMINIVIKMKTFTSLNESKIVDSMESAITTIEKIINEMDEILIKNESI